MNTRDLEKKLLMHLSGVGHYITFEMKVPIYDYDDWSHAFDGNERVDACMYNYGNWYFYELKVSVSDFHSKAKKSFQGNYNYFVMPKDIYEKVKDEIERDYKGVGVYIYDNGIQCVKKPVRQELKVKEENLKIAFMHSLSAQFEKYRYRYDLIRDATKKRILDFIAKYEWESGGTGSADLDAVKDFVERRL